MVDALLNNVPPTALFDSETIRDDYDYTPEKILKFLVKELRFMALAGESPGEQDRNLDTRKKNLEVILSVCKSMMDDEGYSQYDVMLNLCQAEASNVLIAETAEKFDFLPSVEWTKNFSINTSSNYELTDLLDFVETYYANISDCASIPAAIESDKAADASIPIERDKDEAVPTKMPNKSYACVGVYARVDVNA